MTAELEACGSEGERLHWALGCWRASLGVQGAWDQLAYPLALGLGTALMAAYEWSADEGLITLLLLGGLSLVLGLFRPGRAMVSAALLGLVVSGVLAFEAVSGLHPAYETHRVTLVQSLHWSIFLAPALLAAAFGSGVARLVRSRSVP